MVMTYRIHQPGFCDLSTEHSSVGRALDCRSIPSHINRVVIGSNPIVRKETYYSYKTIVFFKKSNQIKTN